MHRLQSKVSWEGASRVKTFAVVAHLQHQFLLLLHQAQRDVAGMSVFRDIVQGFLCNAEEGMFTLASLKVNKMNALFS